MASVELEHGEVVVMSNYPKYPDLKSVEDVARRTLSSSPENGTDMSDHPMRRTNIS